MMDGLLYEINQDMRADRMTDLWKKYGKWLIYTAISIVIVTAAAVYWKHRRHENAMKQTALYTGAMKFMQEGNGKDALATLNAISVPEKSSYYGLVLLKKAEAERSLSHHEEAKKLLVELAKRNDVYGDIGKIMLREASAAASDKPTPLQYSRVEWQAWDLAAKGETKKAAEKFSELSKTQSAPATLRDRAAMMANYLKYQ